MNPDHRTLVTIRAVEHRLEAMCRRGEAGDLHFSRGQEAISVGVMAALRPTDWVVSHHRTISHTAIARGVDLRALLAEVLGKRTGLNGGRAGEMHVHDDRTRYAFSFQLVGTSAPVAAGLAWARKYHHRTDEVSGVLLRRRGVEQRHRARGPHDRGDPERAGPLRLREQRARRQRHPGPLPADPHGGRADAGPTGSAPRRSTATTWSRCGRWPSGSSGTSASTRGRCCSSA